MRARRRSWSWSSGVTGPAAASCSSVQAAPEEPGKPPPPETTVEVRNLKKVDFNLYVLRGASRVRLGIDPAALQAVGPR